MHVSDLKVYFEKAIHKADHTFIPAYMIISLVYNIKGKKLILDKIGCFLPECYRTFTGPEKFCSLLEEIHFIQRSGTEASALKSVSLTLHLHLEPT